MQRRHDAAVQEIGKLDAKLQTVNMDAQNESDLLKNEVNYAIHYYKGNA